MFWDFVTVVLLATGDSGHSVSKLHPVANHVPSGHRPS